ncbi:Adapter protein like [Actinidia chinensis var. chinensis]|uniref:Adapter protein like n=1 Tax=Actinidia chinensis var. chinensis TaxID=1590841 RepID=A0A2R6PPB2_ACTCC|nr:Adapter protein like [Actinidia chinensis var. chinensis]
MPGERKRTVKLFCPTLSKSVPFVAWDEHRLDLGSISRAFGIDPSTLRLNGHFIGRGADLVAWSVTWKSLLCFFSSRGLPAGASDADALIVDGKLSKAGTKRECKICRICFLFAFWVPRKFSKKCGTLVSSSLKCCFVLFG